MKTNTNGFTLLELLVAAGVISFISIIVSQILFSSMHINTKTEVLKEVKQTGTTSLSVLSRMVQNAKTITSICTDIETTPAVVTDDLIMTNVDGGTTTFSCVDDIGSGVSRIASVSATTVYMTSENVTLINESGQTGCINTPLRFTCVSIGGKPVSVQINFGLRQKNTAAVAFEGASDQFQTTAIIRNDE